MITPVPRRRPWQLARQTATLDVLSGGRLILGVGIGSPAYGDFGIFDEPTGDRERADLLDEGLAVLDGLWTGETFAHAGAHFTVHPVRFRPPPVQQPRIPVWVGGVLPPPGPFSGRPGGTGWSPSGIPIGRLSRVSAGDIADVRERIAAARGSVDGADLVVWADVESEARPGCRRPIAPYEQAGTTWWIESLPPGRARLVDGDPAAGCGRVSPHRAQGQASRPDHSSTRIIRVSGSTPSYAIAGRCGVCIAAMRASMSATSMSTATAWG